MFFVVVKMLIFLLSACSLQSNLLCYPRLSEDVSVSRYKTGFCYIETSLSLYSLNFYTLGWTQQINREGQEFEHFTPPLPEMLLDLDKCQINIPYESLDKKTIGKGLMALLISSWTINKIYTKIKIRNNVKIIEIKRKEIAKRKSSLEER